MTSHREKCAVRDLGMGLLTSRSLRFSFCILLLLACAATAGVLPVALTAETATGPAEATASAATGSAPISTVAGGYIGDGGPATEAVLNGAAGLALDDGGNLYIADTNNHRIRKVDPSGTITTVAGTGDSGFSGDGGTGIDARLSSPSGIDVDGSGILYIADTRNNCVRKLYPSEGMATIAGGGSLWLRPGTDLSMLATDVDLTSTVSDITSDGEGNVYICEREGARVLRLEPSGLLSVAIGTGTRGYAGDGGPAARAQLGGPTRILFDAEGNLYVSDMYNHRVRRVDSSGIITTIAGTGEAGFAGDGGAAIQAQLRMPGGIAMDDSGNLYIADAMNHRVRKVDPSGKITTVAGDGSNEPLGNGRVFRGDGGPATQANLKLPLDVVVNPSGELFVADGDGFKGVVRKVDTSGTISTVAGSKIPGGTPNNGPTYAGPATEASFCKPVSLSLDGAGNLYIGAEGDAYIRRVDTAGVVKTVAGTGEYGTSHGASGDGGLATEARIGMTEAVHVDAAGNLYIATTNRRIRKVDPLGVISTVAGGGQGRIASRGGIPATSILLEYPSIAVLDGKGNLYVAERNRIVKVDPDGGAGLVAGNGEYGFSGDGGPAIEASFAGIADIDVDPLGNLYIVDAGNHRVRKVDASGTVRTVVGNGTEESAGGGGPATDASLYWPAGVTMDTSGNLYIAEDAGVRVRKVDAAGLIATVAGGGGNPVTDGANATDVYLDGPRDVLSDASGDLYILVRNRVLKVEAAGTIRVLAGGSSGTAPGENVPALGANLVCPRGVFTDDAGNFYVADEVSSRILRVDASGNIATFAGGGASGGPGYGDGGKATDASLSGPSAGFVDGSGNLYIADRGNHRVRKVDTSGAITTFAGTGEYGFSGDGGPATAASLAGPWSVAGDQAGNVYISDRDNHRIRRVDATGAITTVAGNGLHDYRGDGGPATEAALAWPHGIFVDSSGNLFIADRNNQRVRKVDTSGTITTVAGNGRGGFNGDGGAATDASLSGPLAVSGDQAGNLYIADQLNNRIRMIALSGIISTLAGGDGAGYSGDGDASFLARLDAPSGIAVSPAGNIYIADTGNRRIRQIGISDVYAPALVRLDGCVYGFSPTLEWVEVATASSYTLEYADNADLTNTTVVSGITEAHYQLPSSLPAGDYYWRVKAVGTDGEGPYSRADQFQMTPNHVATEVPPGGLPAFPGAEGYGAYTRGGRGGQVLLVTTLADYVPGEKPIPGSLRAAVWARNYFGLALK